MFNQQTPEQVAVEVTMLRSQLDQIDRQMMLLIREREIVAVKFRLAMSRAAELPNKGETRHVAGRQII
jgi:hypothetical protein